MRKFQLLGWKLGVAEFNGDAGRFDWLAEENETNLPLGVLMVGMLAALAARFARAVLA